MAFWHPDAGPAVPVCRTGGQRQADRRRFADRGRFRLCRASSAGWQGRELPQTGPSGGPFGRTGLKVSVCGSGRGGHRHPSGGLPAGAFSAQDGRDGSAAKSGPARRQKARPDDRRHSAGAIDGPPPSRLGEEARGGDPRLRQAEPAAAQAVQRAAAQRLRHAGRAGRVPDRRAHAGVDGGLQFERH